MLLPPLLRIMVFVCVCCLRIIKGLMERGRIFCSRFISLLFTLNCRFFQSHHQRVPFLILLSCFVLGEVGTYTAFVLLTAFWKCLVWSNNPPFQSCQSCISQTETLIPGTFLFSIVFIRILSTDYSRHRGKICLLPVFLVSTALAMSPFQLFSPFNFCSFRGVHADIVEGRSYILVLPRVT